MKAANDPGDEILAKSRAQTLKTIGEIIDRGSEEALQRFNQNLLADLSTHGLLKTAFLMQDGRYFVSSADPASLAVPTIH